MSIKKFFSFFKFVCSAVIILLISQFINYSEAKAGNEYGIAGIVNKKPITIGDVDARVRIAFLASGSRPTEEAMKSLRPQALRMLMEEELQTQIAKQNNISADEGEVEDRIDAAARNLGISKGAFIKFLASNGISIESVRKQIRASVFWVNYIREKYERLIVVKKSDIDAFIRRSLEDNIGEQCQICEIVDYVDSKHTELQAMQNGKKIRAMLDNGASFHEMARQMSSAPSKESGGMLGWISVNRLDPSIRSAVKHMQPGEFCGPIRIPAEGVADRVVIFALVDRRVVKKEEFKIPSVEDAASVLKQEALARWSKREMIDSKKSAYYKELIK
ncbi:peptidylprolyl isomerase [Candidatus Hydrogenosomobacter endosymbioticus]|nr:peptidylprolyl isomerase [Candidatus Hydrogenosomobacter endosymbioticus]